MEHDLFSLPEHMSSPQSVHILVGFMLFILSIYKSISSRLRSVMYDDTIDCHSEVHVVFKCYLYLLMFNMISMSDDVHVG